MDLVGSLFLFAAIAIVSYTYAKRRRLEQEAKLQSVGHQQILEAKEELDRRARILDKIENFLKSSKFIEPIANWRNEKIYKYIFNNGYLYEFEEIMAENNQRVGMDDEYLCFKQLCYKRVNNPTGFMEKFAHEIA